MIIFIHLNIFSLASTHRSLYRNCPSVFLLQSLLFFDKNSHPKIRKIKKSNTVRLEIVFKVFYFFHLLRENFQKFFLPLNAYLQLSRGHLIQTLLIYCGDFVLSDQEIVIALLLGLICLQLFHLFSPEISDGFIIFTEFFPEEVVTSRGEIEAGPPFHVPSKNSFSPSFDGSFQLNLWVFRSKFFFFRQDASPEIVAVLLRDFFARDFDVIKVVEGDCLVINSGHAVLELFTKSRRSNFGFGGA